MSIDFAVWRQRSTQLLARVQFWHDPADRMPPDLPLSVAPMLFKLAHIAVGDVDSALALTADVLAQFPPEQLAADSIDEGVALGTLLARLPDGWLSWPGAAGPSEWLRLHLRREQADRLLSVLGERDPIDRIALALHLHYNVPRDDLDDWLGTRGMADRVYEFAAYVGEGLELVPLPTDRPECVAIAHDLLDLHEPQLGRHARLHTVGCTVCQRRARGLHETLQLIGDALHVFFRAAMPERLPQLIAKRRYELRQERIVRWRPVAIACMIALLYLVWPRQDVIANPATASRAAAPLTAAQVIDRALDRFTNTRYTGVLHEKIRFTSGNDRLMLERWYDVGASRLRIAVSAPQSPEPVLDLATDGATITYRYAGRSRAPRSTQVRGAEVQPLLPLLRQLPFMGSLGDAPFDQRYLDLALLADARRSNPTLLGTTVWQGRPAFLVSATPQAGRTILTVDQATWSLLEARVGADNGLGETRAVWQADVFEVLPRRTVPAATFTLNEHTTVATQMDPRQFTNRPLALIDINAAAAITPLAIPQQLPEPTLLAYIRAQSRTRNGVVQLYEGQWSTLGIVAPRSPATASSLPLDRAFAGGRYRIVDHQLPQVTIVEFALDAQPQLRMGLYFWHALATDAEREAMVTATLDALTQVDGDTATAYRERFLPANIALRPDWYIRYYAPPTSAPDTLNPTYNIQSSLALR